MTVFLVYVTLFKRSEMCFSCTSDSGLSDFSNSHSKHVNLAKNNKDKEDWKAESDACKPARQVSVSDTCLRRMMYLGISVVSSLKGIMTQMMESEIIDQAKCQHPWYNMKYQLKIKLTVYQGNIKFYFFMQHQKLEGHIVVVNSTSAYQEYECHGHFGHYIISVWNDGTVK